ncbi:hypothetical protein MCOR27_000204 [Pyricularia oryzae]|uniref:Putative lipoate-protein ligase A n=2 Tax=Pyricularia TaxID=48558 RepID=A0ABQ8P154_PYRGI|nr:hypothetical protein MCOR01_004676 [Pyricularia oryzae]KAI6305017.1 hypothetical protein MCOR33_000136 [Pyricularia grisea]KAH9431375.1 hypothetical protein MCOR02_008667 [Pyricularia oryzae]KAI6261934.1 hypothetical protein MCOR19_001883 [Pyricularia oryzae]KAI6287947.1 hypothetical protein MCOR26_000359 [Pyricularia oryzae]
MATAATRIRTLGPGSSLAKEAMRALRGENLTRHAMDERNKLQIYLSTEKDPYLNLAAEQHLLEVSHPSSTVLFMYINRPSVIIGRSQNPWLEVNLGRLGSGLPRLSAKQDEEEAQQHVPVSLVRRRSGGGTVFHDHGNVNWSVIFPTAEFDRDRHAEMVVRALRDRIGVPTVRVNDRHDIVMDVPRKPFSEENKTFKVSGSAYRVTRVRSLHHGTCLVHSPYVDQIGPLLRPPMAGSYLKTRGAGSVRSPVRNVSGGTQFDEVAFGTPFFQAMVIDEFKETYSHLSGPGNELVYSIGPSVMTIPDVEKGYKELTSAAWVYNQTPQFTFSTHPTEMDPRKRPPPPSGVLPTFQANMTIRYGKITECSFKGLVYDREDTAVNEGLRGRELHSITDWRQTLAELSPAQVPNNATGDWLNKVFGNTPEEKTGS